MLLLLLLLLLPAPPRPFTRFTFPAATAADEPIPKSDPQCPLPATPLAAPPGPPDPGDPDNFCFFTPQHPAAILEQSAPTHRFRPITVTAGRVGGKADQTYKSHCVNTFDGQCSTFSVCQTPSLLYVLIPNVEMRLQCHPNQCSHSTRKNK